jgi:hypothetical protein
LSIKAPGAARRLGLLRWVLNKGLSDSLKDSFPDIVPGLRPQVSAMTPKIKDPH